MMSSFKGFKQNRTFDRQRFITAVCGFGRCGSSLVMKMLDKGGMEVFADNDSSYEHAIVSECSDLRWIKLCIGKAVKVLDLKISTLPRNNSYAFVWLHRDPLEQARSQAAFMNVMLGINISEREIGQIARSIELETPKSIAALHRYPSSKVLELSFDELVVNPSCTALQIADFLPGLNVAQMVSVVKTRDPKCQYLRHELELVKNGR